MKAILLVIVLLGGCATSEGGYPKQARRGVCSEEDAFSGKCSCTQQQMDLGHCSVIETEGRSVRDVLMGR